MPQGRGQKGQARSFRMRAAPGVPPTCTPPPNIHTGTPTSCWCACTRSRCPTRRPRTGPRCCASTGATGRACCWPGRRQQGPHRRSNTRPTHPPTLAPTRPIRYQDLTSYVFGKRRGKWALLPFQAAVLVGLAVTYTVVGGDDLHAFATDYATTTPAPPAWVCYIVFGGACALERPPPVWGFRGCPVATLAAVGAPAPPVPPPPPPPPRPPRSRAGAAVAAARLQLPRLGQRPWRGHEHRLQRDRDGPVDCGRRAPPRRRAAHQLCPQGGGQPRPRAHRGLRRHLHHPVCLRCALGWALGRQGAQGERVPAWAH
jgi:hypothetical protein